MKLYFTEEDGRDNQAATDQTGENRSYTPLALNTGDSDSNSSNSLSVAGSRDSTVIAMSDNDQAESEELSDTESEDEWGDGNQVTRV